MVDNPLNRRNQAGSGFVNLQNILKANRANKLGSTISSNINQAGQNVRAGLGQAQTEFQSGAQKERERFGQEEQRVSRVLGSGDISKTSDDDVKAFEQIRGSTMLGPKELKDSQELVNRANTAEQMGNAISNEQGRFGLLQSFIGGNKRGYGIGQQRLDSLLLGQDPGAIRGARKSVMGLGQRTAAQVGASREIGKELEGQARQLGERTLGRLGESIGQYDTSMQSKLDAEKARRQAIVDMIAKGQDSENKAIELDDQTLEMLKEASGGQFKEGTQLLNADLTDQLKLNQMLANKQAAQDQSDFAKAQMLAKLTGQSLAGQEKGGILSSYVDQPQLVGQFAKSNIFDVGSIPELEAKRAQSQAQYKAITDKENTRLGELDTTINNFLRGQAAEAERKDVADTQERMRQQAQQFRALRTIKKKPPVV